MSFPASWKCFFCSNPINENGRHVFATIEHQYKAGDSRQSDRRFHPACFEKFQVYGRPYNPETAYVVIESEAVEPERI